MSITAIILILISACLHAGWNLISKKTEPSLAFFFLANLFGSLILLLPISLYFYDFYQFISTDILIYAALAGIFQGIYYWTLALAYRAGHMSLAYPIARSFPVIFVSATMLLLGFTDILNATFLIGAGLIVSGSIILPMLHFKDFKLSNYTNQATYYALIAAVGTAGYSMIDSKAITQLNLSINALSFNHSEGIIPLTLVYAFVAAIMSSAWMAMVLLRNSSSRLEVSHLFKTQFKTYLSAGVAIHLAYTLVLVSMSMVENVSYIVAFRQISIPLGVLLGITLLNEPHSKPKTMGVLAMFIGVVLVSV